LQFGIWNFNSCLVPAMPAQGIRMTKIISFDMDGTLIASEFTDWVWGHGIPSLYAEKTQLPFEKAKEIVESEYRNVGEAALEWYDIKYWFQFFQLGPDWRRLMERYVDKITVYPDAHAALNGLRENFVLVLTSNAAREFIDVEMGATGLSRYFNRIFSATSDFRRVKKNVDFYHRICQILDVMPEEIVHVGDHYEFDYLVPQAIGIKAFYLDRSARQGGDSVVWDLGELEKRLRS
jgi:HAD superfamily hydrolase (TIGR01493 family)